MRNIELGVLFGIALIAVGVILTTWSVGPTVGKTPAISVDPQGLVTTTTKLPQSHYRDRSTIY
jgi:hypothetical protein